MLNVALVRKQRNIKQMAVAEHMGWSQSLVSKLESGRYTPSADDLVKLAKFLKWKKNPMILLDKVSPVK